MVTAIVRWTVTSALIFLLVGCEDTLSPLVNETVRLANLPERSVTIQPGTNGSVAPAGVVKVKDNELLSLSAQANLGYSFYRWEKVSGTGTVSFANASATDTSVRVTGGDAVLRAVIDDNSFAVTVVTSGAGTTNISSFPTLTKGVASASITATSGSEANFTGWSVTAGAGITFAPNASAATVTITANAGDATVQATFVPKTYVVTLSNDGGGYPTPYSSTTVTSGVAKAIVATPYETYVFNNWTKTAGAGTVVFGNASQASTTVTVTGGPATIRANFRKEVLTLAETGTAGPFTNGQTTHPENVRGYYFDPTGKGLFVVGDSGLSYGVLRRLNLGSTASPTGGGSNDYLYLTGTATPQALYGDGTSLFVGTSSHLLKVPMAGFDSGATATRAVSGGVVDVTAAADPNYLWVVRSDRVDDHRKSNLVGPTSYSLTNTGGWSYTSALANGYGLFAVHEDNGANELAGYMLASPADPSSTVAPHDGVDMEPGDVRKLVFNEDSEYLAAPVMKKDDTWHVQIYDATAADGMASSVGSVAVGGEIRRLAWQGPYVYAAGTSGGLATVWIIDAASLASPVIRKTLTVSGWASAEAAFLDGTTLWVVLDGATGAGASTKIGVKAFGVTRN